MWLYSMETGLMYILHEICIMYLNFLWQYYNEIQYFKKMNWNVHNYHIVSLADFP